MIFVKKREICRKSPLDFPSDDPERWISVKIGENDVQLLPDFAFIVKIEGMIP